MISFLIGFGFFSAMIGLIIFISKIVVYKKYFIGRRWFFVLLLILKNVVSYIFLFLWMRKWHLRGDFLVGGALLAQVLFVVFVIFQKKVSSRRNLRFEVTKKV